MAYEFNGTKSLTTSSTPASGTPYTMACWFKSDTVGGVNTANGGALVCLNQSSNSSFQFLVLFNSQVGINSANSAGAQVGFLAATANFTTNVWGHAAGVFESSTSRSIFFNGGNKATQTLSSTPSAFNQITIGARRSPSIGIYHDGLIAEAGIWDVALTDAEVGSLAKGMTCDKVRPQNLVFYAPLVRDLQDVRGGLTITNNNTATVAAHPRVYA
jgi:hypothetical protein